MVRPASRPRTSAILPIATLAAAILCVGTPPAAGRSLNKGVYAGAPTEASVYGGDEDIVVVTVLAVQDSNSTDTHSPLVTVRVDEFLRGNLKRGKHVVEWRPVQFSVSLKPRYRGGEATPNPGPAVGSRFVLGLHRDPSGRWWNDPSRRWNADTPEGQHARASVLEWNASVAARLRREQTERERKQRLAEEQQRKDRAARELAEKELQQRERDWLAFERAAREHSDLERLVRSSDAIALGPVPVASAASGAAWGKFALMKPSSWLLAPADTSVNRGRIALLFGQREDSLRTRWLAAPPDDRPGMKQGDSLRTIAFLRYAQDRIAHTGPDPYLRPADPLSGILRADEKTVRRVRDLIARRGVRPPEPLAPCGAALEEFAVNDSIEACSIGLKLSLVNRRELTHTRPGIVLVSGLQKSTEGMSTLDAGSFTPCALPDDQYVHEFRSSWNFRIRPVEMKALVDSLLLFPELVEGRVDPAGLITLALRRIVDGRERIYETTLDSYTQSQICRVLSSIIHGDPTVRMNLGNWWSLIDERFSQVWSPPPPQRKVAPVFHGTAPTPDPKRGSVVGWLRDGQSDTPIPGAFVRTLKPSASFVTDDEGAFALRDFPPGRRWVEFSGPYHEMSLGFLDFTKGSVDTVVVYIEPNGKTPAPRDTTFDRNESWLPVAKRPPENGASLVVNVRDQQGDPVPRAYVVLSQGGTMFGGLAGTDGRMLFPAIAPGSGEVLVRSARHEPLRRTIEFRPEARDSLELSLVPRAR